MKDNDKDLFLSVFKKKIEKRPPIWLMRQAGRHLPEYISIRNKVKSFLDLCYNPELSAEITLQPIKRYNLDAAILFSDILIIPNALGQNVTFKEGKGPILTPLENKKSIEDLNVELSFIKTKEIMDGILIIREKYKYNKTLIGFCGAPWTVSTYMIEGKNTKNFELSKNWVFSRKKDMEFLFEKIIFSSIEYLSSQIKHGVDVIKIFDSWAGILPEEEFNDFVIKPTRIIIDEIKKRFPHIPIICFPRGAGPLYENFIAETGCDAVALDSTVPLPWAQKYLQPHTILQGNLDPMALVVGGSVLKNKIKRILDILGNDRFIFNLGHGILPQTPIKNVEYLIEEINSYYK